MFPPRYLYKELMAMELIEQQFAGLMAVVDVLADIHGIDLASAEVAKSLFVKQAA